MSRYTGTVSIRLDSVLTADSLAHVEESAASEGTTPASLLHDLLVAAGFAVTSVDWRPATTESEA